MHFCNVSITFTKISLFFSGDNVEDAFLETARRIYQNIQDGSLDLNQADTGVQPKTTIQRPGATTENPAANKQCNC